MSDQKEMSGLVTGLVALLAVACFFVLGFTIGAWHIVWVVFIAIPITWIIMDIIGKKKDVSGAIVGIVAILAAIVFFLMGFFLHIWYVAWIVFLAVPITATVINICKAAGKNKDNSAGQ